MREFNEYEGVYLFGSHARGDAEINSDRDILIVSEHGYTEKYNHTDLRFRIENNSDYSFYSLDKIKEFYSSGSLFAWHLFLEAKFLYGYNYLAEIGTPSEYSTIECDLSHLLELLDSVEGQTLRRSESVSYVYEAGLLYIVIRNSSHCFSWFELEKPSFNRFTPFLLKEADRLDLSLKEYEILLAARLATSRGLQAPIIDPDWLLEKVKSARLWINFKMGLLK